MKRYHSLDRLRAVAMLLGLVLHSTVHYFVLPDSVVQVYLDRNRSSLLELLFSFIHAYRMPVFFVISGFFSAFLCARGRRSFLVHRWKRVGIPLILGIVILFPMVALATYVAQLSTTGPKMTAEQLGSVIDGLFMHLWFLYYLLIFCVAAAGVSLLAPRVPESFRHAVLDLFGRSVHGLLLPLILSAPTAVALFHMEAWTFDYSSSPFPPLRLLSAYALFFAFGWFVFERRDVLEGFTRHAWIRLAAGVSCFLLYRHFYIQNADPTDSTLDHVAAIAFLALSVWLIIYACLGLFLRYFDSPSFWWRYLADASYWMYLVHLPVTIALAPLLADIDVAAPTKFLFVFLSTAVITLITYHFLVRATFVGAHLNGRRYPRVPPWSSRKLKSAG